MTPEALFEEALAHQRANRLDEALRAYERALALRADFAEALFNMTGVLQSLGRLGDAQSSLERVEALLPAHPDMADAWSGLGAACHAQGDHASARACFERAAALRPGDADALGNLAVSLQSAGDVDGAIYALRRALALDPAHVARANSLSGMLQMRGELAEASDWLQRALARRPEDPDVLYNLGNLRQYQGRLDEAVACFERAERARPGFADARVARALALLSLGDYARGWAEYEARYGERQSRPIAEAPDLPFPPWRGEPLEGRRLLLVGEQGYGDYLQFARYAPLLAARGAVVDLLAPPPLVRLLSGLAGVRRVFSTLTSADYDYWAMLLSLPFRLGTRLDSVPARIPYLKAPAAEAARWAQRLDARAAGRLKAGLVWAGSPAHRLDRFRSMRLEALAPLARLRSVCLIGLQKQRPATAETGAGFPELDFGADLVDFADAAGLIENLDVLVSVDTAPAHLAGALGRPVLLLLAAIPDWRWMRGRPDTPWYPTMRLLRQDVLGDWAPVVARVARELAARAAGRGAAAGDA